MQLHVPNPLSSKLHVQATTGLLQERLREAMTMPVKGHADRRKRKRAAEGADEAAGAAAAGAGAGAAEGAAGAANPRVAALDAVHSTMRSAQEPKTVATRHKAAIEFEEWLQANPHLIEPGYNTLETARPKEVRCGCRCGTAGGRVLPCHLSHQMSLQAALAFSPYQVLSYPDQRL